MTTLRLRWLVLLATMLAALAVAQPVNDNFGSPSLFNPAGNIVSGTIVGATREPGEDSRFAYSVWWRWTAPSNGVFTFVAEAEQFRPFLLIAPASTNLLAGTNSFFGIIAPTRFATEFPVTATQGVEYSIALFTRSVSPRVGDYTLRVVASAPPSATWVIPASIRTRHIVGQPLELEVEANDPDGEVVRVDFFMSLPLLGSTSSPPFRISASTAGAIADRDYRLFAVAVDDSGLFGVAGHVVSNQVDQIREIAFRQPPPPNDSFDARVPLSGDIVRLEANNGGADREIGEPATGEQTLWWSWNAPTSKYYYVLARGYLSVPQVSVFTGNTLSALNFVSHDENSGCGSLGWGGVQAQAGQTYVISVGDACQSFGGPFTLHILPGDAPTQIAGARIRRAGEVWNVPVFELFAVGLLSGWFVECSDDLQSWTPCDNEFPYGWVDGVSNWADTFYAPVAADGSPRFYRLRRMQ